VGSKEKKKEGNATITTGNALTLDLKITLGEWVAEKEGDGRKK